MKNIFILWVCVLGACLAPSVAEAEEAPAVMTTLSPRDSRVPPSVGREMRRLMAKRWATLRDDYRAAWEARLRRVCPERGRECAAVVSYLELYRSTYGSFCGTNQLVAARGLSELGEAAVEPLVRVLGALDDLVIVGFAAEMLRRLGAETRVRRWCGRHGRHGNFSGVCGG